MSRFVRTLPLLDAAPVRVLICDDSAELRDLLRMRIEADPGTALVAEAADGVEALRMAAAVSAEVVVLDLGMPGPTPRELIVGLQQRAPESALVLYSGSSGTTLGVHRRNLSLEIEKGTPPAEVVRVVRELGRARRRAAAAAA